MTARLITPGELLQFPTGVDWNALAEDAGATDPLQAIEQGILIDSISAWAGHYCGQPLGLHATTQTEQARVERAGTLPAKCIVDPSGNLHFWTTTLPVLSLGASQWAYLIAGLAWNPITPGNAQPGQSGASWLLWGDYPQQRHIELFDQDYSALKDTQRAVVQVQYTSGWANAVMSGGPYAAGSNVSIAVDTTLGMSSVAGAAGNRVFIADGSASEWVTVSGVTDATHFTCALANPHTPNANTVIGVSAVPQDLKMAVIYACAAIARVRGVQAFQMKTEGVSEVAKSGGQEELMTLAEYHLNPYRIEF